MYIYITEQQQTKCTSTIIYFLSLSTYLKCYFDLNLIKKKIFIPDVLQIKKITVLIAIYKPHYQFHQQKSNIT